MCTKIKSFHVCFHWTSERNVTILSITSRNKIMTVLNLIIVNYYILYIIQLLHYILLYIQKEYIPYFVISISFSYDIPMFTIFDHSTLSISARLPSIVDSKSTKILVSSTYTNAISLTHWKYPSDSVTIF